MGDNNHRVPPIDDEGHLVHHPEAILDTRERHLRSRAVFEYLIRWKSLLDEEATWEGGQILQYPSLQLLALGGEDCNIPN